MSERLTDLHVRGTERLITPRALKAALPLDAASARVVASGRAAVEAILEGRDPRLLAIVGPCSIHDPEAALEYARRLAAVRADVGDRFEVVMRVYFEKPRTTIGWKGLINDPHLDGTYDVEKGLHIARRLLLEVAALGLPAATEFLDPIVPQYLADLVSWAAVGARTTESQTHREMASGLSAPVGFKNGTDGGLEVAINAIRSARSSHGFLGMNSEGRTAVIRSRGNPYGHLVLRGGGGRPNYDTVSVRIAEQALVKAKIEPNIVIDCSHANAMKDHTLQPLVFSDCMHQVREGNRSIVGLMLESNLEAGSQSIPEDRSTLRYGVSVTDACIDWSTTEELLLRAHREMGEVLARRLSA